MSAHSEILFSKCAHFREQGEFIDVRLKVGEDEFAAHRIVLAANSDYFHAMFAHGMKESNQELIELKDENISVTAMKIIIDSMYSGKIHLDYESVFEVLTAADHLQVASVVEQCCKYLTQLRFDVQTYCRVIMVADQHSLKDLKEATERKMASMYKDICEKEEFLSDMNVDVLSALLCRDDLSAPSENFVFKSVMQWIKYRKKERMDVAAQVIGAVRLGLVDIKDVIEELRTEEMQVIPEINTLLQETLIHNCRPSSSSAFALEKGKPRSMTLVLVSIYPEGAFCYFDVQSKTWKQLSSLQKLPGAIECYCTELVGNYLYVAAKIEYDNVICCYDILCDSWSTLPPIPGSSRIEISSLCHIEDHLYVIYKSSAPYRYNIATNHWQSVASLSGVSNLSQITFSKIAVSMYKLWLYVLYGQEQFWYTGTESNPIFCSHVAAAEYKSCLYALYAQGQVKDSYFCKPYNSVLCCFDPEKNVWEKKASTKTPHFGSSLLVVNNKLYVAGGRCSFQSSMYEVHGSPAGDPAAIEVYNDQENAWSVVKQTHIPPNNLGAVEIDGRVYFIINSFPVDSGITIRLGEVFPATLNEWKKLGKVKQYAGLGYVPLNTENLYNRN